jgi:glutamate dehydrogenase/leucine dehydrogenase
MASVEVLDPADFLTQDDRGVADALGLDHGHQDRLMYSEIHHIGPIELQGERPHEAMVIMTGPTGVIHQGGTKFKEYSGYGAHWGDTRDHGISMLYKNDNPTFGALKIVADINPNPRDLSPEARVERRKEALTQLGGLMFEAGLTDPRRLGTSGDEGTNGLIAVVLPETFGRLGVAHPEALVTGKPDMTIRPSATGRGAAVGHRELMRLNGETSAGVVIQGAGFAGAYYAAEAYDPIDPADRDVTLIPYALGDVRFEKLGEDEVVAIPVTLSTDHPDGLPITYKMVNSILLDPFDADMVATGHDKLLALARKIERETGVSVRIEDKDVLTYDKQPHPNMYLAPAATSNVLGIHNVKDVGIKKWVEIGNHTVTAELLPLLGHLGIKLAPGELINSRGVATSYLEKMRDLARIEAAENGKQYTGITDEEYAQILREDMLSLTRLTHWTAQEYGCDLAHARKIVSLGNYAASRGMRIDHRMRRALQHGPQLRAA